MLRDMPTRQRIRQLLKFALIIGVLAACATAEPRVFDAPAPAVPTSNKKLFNEAFMAQQKGQYTKAIGLWKEYLRVEPNSFEALNNLGMVYYAEDRLSDSIAAFQSARQMAQNRGKCI